MFGIRSGLLLIILIFLATGGYHRFDFVQGWFQQGPAPQITEQRREHILYGDKSGGGHRYGAGKPCKSEFPKNWSDENIIERVQTMAANDNMDWQRESNGYYTAEGKTEGVKVKIVLSRDRSEVITAYPVGVKRNPCGPRVPVNDNYNG